MRRLIAIALTFAVVTVFAAPALAQGTGTIQGTGVSSSQRKPGSKPKAPRRPIGYRAYFTFDSAMMAARDSFDAVTGSSNMFGYGAGGEILNLWKTLFVRVSWSQSSADGQRPIVFENEVFPTEFPIEIGLRLFELGGGWRIHLSGLPNIVLYGGGGLLMAGYRETNPTLTEAENLRESHKGFSGFGGLEFTLSRMLTAGAEVQYRRISTPMAPFGTVFRAFEESDLGGISIRALVGYRFGK